MEIHVKVVPGSSRDQIVGRLGDALKIKVAAPPEGGKANEAVCSLLAQALGLSRGQVRIAAGHSRPLKRLEISGVSPQKLAQWLAQIG